MRNLPWLPTAPADYSAQCRALAGVDADIGPSLQRLATFHIPSPGAMAFRRALAKAQRDQKDLSPLSPLKLAVVSSATMGSAQISPCILRVPAPAITSRTTTRLRQLPSRVPL